jgi:hypothetical protein
MGKRILLRSLLGLTSVNLGLTAFQFYTIHSTNKQLHQDLYDEHGSRIDTFEYTFREHIGVVESSLARIEGKNIFDEYNREQDRSSKK